MKALWYKKGWKTKKMDGGNATQKELKSIQELEITYKAFIDQTCQTCSVVQEVITVFNIRVGLSTRQQLISAWTFLVAAL